jgi:tape measure domain-containing protein
MPDRYEISYRVKEVLAQLEQIHVHTNISFQDSLNTTNSLLSSIKQKIGAGGGETRSIDGKLNLDTSQLETVFRSLASSAADDSQTISANFGEARVFSGHILSDSKELQNLLKAYNKSEAQQLGLRRQILQDERDAIARNQQRRQAEAASNLKGAKSEVLQEQRQINAAIKEESRLKKELQQNLKARDKIYTEAIKSGTAEVKKLKKELSELDKQKSSTSSILRSTDPFANPEYYQQVASAQRAIAQRAEGLAEIIRQVEARIDRASRDFNAPTRTGQEIGASEQRLNQLTSVLSRLEAALTSADRAADDNAKRAIYNEAANLAKGVNQVTSRDREGVSREANLPSLSDFKQIVDRALSRLDELFSRVAIPDRDRSPTSSGVVSTTLDNELQSLKEANAAQLRDYAELLKSIKETAKVEKQKNESNLEQLKLLKATQDKLTAASKEADTNVTRAAQSLQQLQNISAPTEAISLAEETLRKATEYANTIQEHLLQVTTYSNTTSEDFKAVATSSLEAKERMDSLASELKKAVAEVGTIDNRFAASGEVVDRAQRAVRQFAEVLVAFHNAFSAERERQPNLAPVELAVQFPTLDDFIGEIRNVQTSLSGAIDLVKQSVREFRTEAARPIVRPEAPAREPVVDRSPETARAVVVEFERLLPVARQIISRFQALATLLANHLDRNREIQDRLDNSVAEFSRNLATAFNNNLSTFINTLSLDSSSAERMTQGLQSGLDRIAANTDELGANFTKAADSMANLSSLLGEKSELLQQHFERLHQVHTAARDSGQPLAESDVAPIVEAQRELARTSPMGLADDVVAKLGTVRVKQTEEGKATDLGRAIKALDNVAKKPTPNTPVFIEAVYQAIKSKGLVETLRESYQPRLLEEQNRLRDLPSSPERDAALLKVEDALRKLNASLQDTEATFNRLKEIFQVDPKKGNRAFYKEGILQRFNTDFQGQTDLQRGLKSLLGEGFSQLARDFDRPIGHPENSNDRVEDSLDPNHFDRKAKLIDYYASARRGDLKQTEIGWGGKDTIATILKDLGATEEELRKIMPQLKLDRIGDRIDPVNGNFGNYDKESQKLKVLPYLFEQIKEGQLSSHGYQVIAELLSNILTSIKGGVEVTVEEAIKLAEGTLSPATGRTALQEAEYRDRFKLQNPLDPIELGRVFAATQKHYGTDGWDKRPGEVTPPPVMTLSTLAEMKASTGSRSFDSQEEKHGGQLKYQRVGKDAEDTVRNILRDLGASEAQLEASSKVLITLLDRFRAEQGSAGGYHAEKNTVHLPPDIMSQLTSGDVSARGYKVLAHELGHVLQTNFGQIVRDGGDRYTDFHPISQGEVLGTDRLEQVDPITGRTIAEFLSRYTPDKHGLEADSEYAAVMATIKRFGADITDVWLEVPEYLKAKIQGITFESRSDRLDEFGRWKLEEPQVKFNKDAAQLDLDRDSKVTFEGSSYALMHDIMVKMGASVEELGSFNFPEIKEWAERNNKADGEYDATANKIYLQPGDKAAIENGEISTLVFRVLAHELAHVLQTGFGTITDPQHYRKLAETTNKTELNTEDSVRGITPLQWHKQYGDKDARTQELELEAELAAARVSNAHFTTQYETKKVAKRIEKEAIAYGQSLMRAGATVEEAIQHMKERGIKIGNSTSLLSDRNAARVFQSLSNFDPNSQDKAEQQGSLLTQLINALVGADIAPVAQAIQEVSYQFRDLYQILNALAQSSYGINKALESVSVTMQEIESMPTSQRFDLAQSRAAETYQRFLDLSGKTGVGLTTLTQNYAGIAAGSIAGDISRDQAFDVTSNVTIAGQAMGLTQDAVNRALTAISQAYSKGVLQGEELRQQLAEAIPAASAIMAKSLGVSTAELQKMTKTGELIPSEVFPKFSAALKAIYGSDTQIEEIRKSYVGSLNNLVSAFDRFKIEFGKEENNPIYAFLKPLNNISAAILNTISSTEGLMNTALTGLGITFSVGLLAALKQPAIKDNLKQFKGDFLGTFRDIYTALGGWKGELSRLLGGEIFASLVGTEKGIIQNVTDAIKTLAAFRSSEPKKIQTYEEFKVAGEPKEKSDRKGILGALGANSDNFVSKIVEATTTLTAFFAAVSLAKKGLKALLASSVGSDIGNALSNGFKAAKGEAKSFGKAVVGIKSTLGSLSLGGWIGGIVAIGGTLATLALSYSDFEGEITRRTKKTREDNLEALNDLLIQFYKIRQIIETPIPITVLTPEQIAANNKSEKEWVDEQKKQGKYYNKQGIREQGWAFGLDLNSDRVGQITHNLPLLGLPGFFSQSNAVNDRDIRRGYKLAQKTADKTGIKLPNIDRLGFSGNEAFFKSIGKTANDIKTSRKEVEDELKRVVADVKSPKNKADLAEYRRLSAAQLERQTKIEALEEEKTTAKAKGQKDTSKFDEEIAKLQEEQKLNADSLAKHTEVVSQLHTQYETALTNLTALADKTEAALTQLGTATDSASPQQLKAAVQAIKLDTGFTNASDFVKSLQGATIYKELTEVFEAALPEATIQANKSQAAKSKFDVLSKESEEIYNKKLLALYGDKAKSPEQRESLEKAYTLDRDKSALGAIADYIKQLTTEVTQINLSGKPDEEGKGEKLDELKKKKTELEVSIAKQQLPDDKKTKSTEKPELSIIKDYRSFQDQLEAFVREDFKQQINLERQKVDRAIAFAQSIRDINSAIDANYREAYVNVRNSFRSLNDTLSEIATLEIDTQVLLAPSLISVDNEYAEQFKDAVAGFLPALDSQQELEDERMARLEEEVAYRESTLSLQQETESLERDRLRTNSDLLQAEEDSRISRQKELGDLSEQLNSIILAAKQHNFNLGDVAAKTATVGQDLINAIASVGNAISQQAQQMLSGAIAGVSGTNSNVSDLIVGNTGASSSGANVHLEAKNSNGLQIFDDKILKAIASTIKLDNGKTLTDYANTGKVGEARDGGKRKHEGNDFAAPAGAKIQTTGFQNIQGIKSTNGGNGVQFDYQGYKVTLWHLAKAVEQLAVVNNNPVVAASGGKAVYRDGARYSVTQEQLVRDGLTRRGYQGQALAVGLATLRQESQFDPYSRNPKSGAIGLGQWLGDRKAGLKPLTGDLRVDIENQLNHFDREMNQTNTYYKKGMKKSFKQQLYSLSDSEELMMVMNSFERFKGWQKGTQAEQAGERYGYYQHYSNSVGVMPTFAPPSITKPTVNAPVASQIELNKIQERDRLNAEKQTLDANHEIYKKYRDDVRYQKEFATDINEADALQRKLQFNSQAANKAQNEALKQAYTDIAKGRGVAPDDLYEADLKPLLEFYQQNLETLAKEIKDKSEAINEFKRKQGEQVDRFGADLTDRKIAALFAEKQANKQPFTNEDITNVRQELKAAVQQWKEDLQAAGTDVKLLTPIFQQMGQAAGLSGKTLDLFVQSQLSNFKSLEEMSSTLAQSQQDFAQLTYLFPQIEENLLKNLIRSRQIERNSKEVESLQATVDASDNPYDTYKYKRDLAQTSYEAKLQQYDLQIDENVNLTEEEKTAEKAKYAAEEAKNLNKALAEANPLFEVFNEGLLNMQTKGWSVVDMLDSLKDSILGLILTTLNNRVATDLSNWLGGLLFGKPEGLPQGTQPQQQQQDSGFNWSNAASSAANSAFNFLFDRKDKQEATTKEMPAYKGDDYSSYDQEMAYTGVTAGLGDLFGFAYGTPNYAGGRNSIKDAMLKERAQSGKKPYLAVLNQDESVLSTLNGDNQLYLDLRRNGIWDNLKSASLRNLANGSTSYGDRNNDLITVGTKQVYINQINSYKISAEDSYRMSDRQLAHQNELARKRAERLN